MVPEMNELLRGALEMKASDLHLASGMPPMVRINGSLRPLKEYPSLSSRETLALARQVMSPGRLQDFQETRNQDFSLALPALGRFRISCYFHQGSVGMAIRLMGRNTPFTLEELGLPPVLKTLIHRKKGLLLITGPSGSGKSTTLAALIHEINGHAGRLIITLEDPVEYIHKPKKCMISQREMGVDSLSYTAALRACLRHDPDVIMVGEMRDLETISTVITAAETGHLVLASLHTLSAPQSIERMVDAFPARQQQQVRIQLANSLIGIISQLLLKGNEGGRVLAPEVLVVNAAVRNLIREGKVHQIGSIMEISGHLAMTTMDASLKNLMDRGIISAEEAAPYILAQEGFPLRERSSTGEGRSRA